MPVPVIFDTDIGSDIDDTWALGLLLRCPVLARRKLDPLRHGRVYLGFGEEKLVMEDLRVSTP